jgi:hypothetical protein
MQGIPPEDPKSYLPLPLNSPKGSPEQRAVQDNATSQLESSNSLKDFQIIYDSLESFRLYPTPLSYSGYERRSL